MSPSENKLESQPKLQKNVLKTIDNVPRKASFKCRGHKISNQRSIKKLAMPTSSVKALALKYNQLSQVTQPVRQETPACKHNCASVRVTLNTKPKIIYPKPVTKKDCLDAVQRNKKLVPKVLVDIDLNEVPIQVPKTHQNNVLTVKSAIQLFESNEKEIQVKKVEQCVVKPKPIAKIKPILKKPEPVYAEECKVRIINVRKDFGTEEIKICEEVEEKLKEEIVSLEVIVKQVTKIPEIFTQISQTSVDYDDKPVKRSEGKEKNTSTLFKRLSRKTVTSTDVEKKERKFVKLLKQNTHETNEDLKPNTSFLWTKTNEDVKESKTCRTGMPLPLPPVDFIPNIEYQTRNELIYDDVNSCKVESTHSDVTEYDDIDIYDEIHKESSQNDTTSTDLPKYDYCTTQTALQQPQPEQYDDCEGDGYQYVSSDTQEQVKQDSTNDDKVEQDTADVDNIYESIYDHKQAHYIVSNVSDISSNSNKSTYEKNNSIYGISVNNDFNASQGSLATSVSDETTSVVSSANSHPRSETSNSDQWVDEASESEPELTTLVIRERVKKNRTSVSPSWSVKVRRQWSKKGKDDDEPHISDSDHLYESINEHSQTPTRECYNEDLIDDFDSNSSDDGEANCEPTTELPEVPEKGLKKSLKQAGKILRRNFTLKKSDISFNTFKKKKKKSVEEVFSQSDDKTNEHKTVDSNITTFSENINSDSSYSSGKNGKKTWRIKEKFKRNSVGSLSSNQDTETDHRNSTFYLSIESKDDDDKKELLNKIQSRLIERSTSEVAKQMKKQTQRHSVPAILERSITRPNIPPPPPPPTDTIEYACLDDNSFRRPDSADKHVEQTKRYKIGYSYYNTDSKSTFFVTQQLYQLYTASAYQDEREEVINIDEDSDVDNFYKLVNPKRTTLDKRNEVRTNRQNILQIKTLWCQVQEVVNSQILPSLTEQRKKLQEAKFEIITSEVSYVNSLNVLTSHFISNLDANNIIVKRDFKMLFNNIPNVKKCAENFLRKLEICWEEDILLPDICDVVYNSCNTDFNCYIKFCKNQVHMEQTLTELLKNHAEFSSFVKDLESESICQNQTLRSFLMLPMQRITRLPLLVGAVLARLDTTDEEYTMCRNTFDLLNKIVKECDDELTKMQRCEDMLRLSQQLEFPSHIKSIPIITKSRHIMKQGCVQQLVTRDDSKLTFSKKFVKITLHLFLFPDLLLITKKKSESSYTVVDHCPRNLLQIDSEITVNLPVKRGGAGSVSNSGSGASGTVDYTGKFHLMLTLLENHEGRELSMVLLFNEESDRQRWAEVLTPNTTSDNPEECIYEEWDCPMYRVIDEFCATQTDELSLCIGDKVNILRKTSDGLAYGERIRDGAKGWFPLSYTFEIKSEHQRAKNKKQRYQVLNLSRKFIDSQMKIIN